MFSERRNISLLVIGALFILVALYPFWIFQQYSAMGWYDEVSAHIPWNILLKINETPFLHEFAGGVGRGSSLVLPQWSFYQFLLGFSDGWVASSLFRFTGFFLFFTGTYFLGRRLFNSSASYAFSVSILATGTSYILYGWTLGGHLFDLGLIPWLTLSSTALLAEGKKTFVALAAIVVPFLVSPIFFPLLFVFHSLVLNCLLLERPSLRKKFVALLVLFVFLFTGVLVFNWQNIRIFLVNGAETVRYHLSLQENFSIGVYTAEYFLSLYRWFSRFSNGPLLFAVAASVAFFPLRAALKMFFYLSFIIFIIPYILTCASKVLALGPFAYYRWEVANILFPQAAALFFFNLESLILRWKPFFCGGLLVLSVLAFQSSIDLTIDGLTFKGGWGVATRYGALHKFGREHRFVTDYRTLDWSIPIYYGLRSFDGFQSSKTLIRDTYLKHNVYADPELAPRNAHAYSYFFFYNRSEVRYKVEGFARANVKYILSRHGKITELGSPVAIIPGISLDSNTDILGASLLSRLFPDTSLVGKLYVYEVPNSWDWVFVPTKTIASAYSSTSPEYFKELGSIVRHGMLVAAEQKRDLASSGKLKILGRKLVDGHFQVDLNSETGLVVFNQEYSRDWKAYCDGKKSALLPVNAIMMAAVVSSPCKSLEVIYFSKAKKIAF